MSKLTLQGHVLMVYLDSWQDVLVYLSRNPLPQVSIQASDDKYILSRPLPEDERGAYAHLYRQAAKNKGKGKPDGPGPNGPRGGGPGGTPGAGRAPRRKKKVTKAVAA